MYKNDQAFTKAAFFSLSIACFVARNININL